MSESELLEMLDYLEDNDVRFVRLQFTDLDGKSRNVAVSPFEFERIVKDGYPIRTVSLPGFEAAEEKELFLKPIPSTRNLLPWRPQEGSVVKVVCDVVKANGEPFKEDSRYILKQVVNQAKEQGIQFQISVKIEFSLFELDQKGRPTHKPCDDAGFCDLAPLDRGENVRRDIILTLEDMGFSINSSHHESGKGQHEIDFDSSDPLSCADNIQTFKSVVKSVAQLHGLHASFMPKPINGDPGNGMHIIISMLKDGEDAFRSEDDQLISREGRHFSAGILRRLPEILSFTNPTVNSYKRLAGGFSAPKDLLWRPKENDAVIRIPPVNAGLSEIIVRSPDASGNPYLAFALLIAAGLEGIDQEMSPESAEGERLPATLEEAVRKTCSSEFVSKVIGKSLLGVFCMKKRAEWDDYLSTVHDWEYRKYFLNL